MTAPIDLARSVLRWGVPEHEPHLSPEAEAFLRDRIGPLHPQPLAELPTEQPALAPDLVTALAAVVGAANVSTAWSDRLGHSGGMSYLDLVARRTGRWHPPGAVVRPGSHDEVCDLLRMCEDRRLAIVPFGGGTSVVGALGADRPGWNGVVSVALDRMADLIDLDEVSRTVRVGPGMTGPVLERLLEARGYTLGHHPQSWERASIGGYAATRSSGQASAGYGRSDAMIERLTMATPRGTWTAGRAPASAAGPDLREVILGSEGAFGVITEVTLRVRTAPAVRRYEGFLFPSFEAGCAAYRELVQSRIPADVMRLSDVDETRTTMLTSAPGGRAGAALRAYLRARGVENGALAILGWEGVSAQTVGARRTAGLGVLRRHGAVSLSSKVGGSWLRHRYDGPYLRDVLLDAGCLVETLETATDWARLPALHERVRRSLEQSLGAAYVMAHVSHVYETGASLYFTVLAAADARDPVEQWSAAKAAACREIVASGATITHHHAVGRDHAPYLGAEIGDVGVSVLRAIKAAVDPVGICNPGVLIAGA